MARRDHQACEALIAGLCLVAAPAVLRADCGCDSISIRSGQGGPTTSSIYCTRDLADIDDGCENLGKGAEGCGAEAYAYRCSLGPLSFAVGEDQRVGWGFEVAATLTSGSDPADCGHAQLATRTATAAGWVSPNQSAEDDPEAGVYEFHDGPTVKVVASPKAYPEYGATNDRDQPIFGADGYTEGIWQSNLDFHAAPPQITWIDTPDFNWDREEGEQGAARWEFMQWVDASDDQSQANCWCRFTIERTWNGESAGGVGLRFVAGRNCGLATS